MDWSLSETNGSVHETYRKIEKIELDPTNPPQEPLEYTLYPLMK
jgi:hypothetical protein